MATLKELVEAHELPFCFIDEVHGDFFRYYATAHLGDTITVRGAGGHKGIANFKLDHPYTDYEHYCDLTEIKGAFIEQDPTWKDTPTTTHSSS